MTPKHRPTSYISCTQRQIRGVSLLVLPEWKAMWLSSRPLTLPTLPRDEAIDTLQMTWWLFSPAQVSSPHFLPHPEHIHSDLCLHSMSCCFRSSFQDSSLPLQINFPCGAPACPSFQMLPQCFLLDLSWVHALPPESHSHLPPHQLSVLNPRPGQTSPRTGSPRWIYLTHGTHGHSEYK